YALDKPMTFYSPGGKKKKESWDEYYERKTLGLVTFIRDAIKVADGSKDSPFANLHYDSTDGTIRDEKGRKTVFLIFHAGSSYLTDGGEQGSMGQDTPSDMIDVFVSSEFFKYFKDTLKLNSSGIEVKGANSSFIIDEIMMCSETSNQDGLNWGIQGILVNQVARQLGIPDLFSTSSGISGIGAFCIMDFAGYSAGKGFIPPYPSAWVRAFMGWDKPIIAPVPGEFNVKALSCVLDRDTAGLFTNGDTTILLVPINDHEYYLIENRQRNLQGNRELFKYDTTESDSVVIASYPYNVNIEKNVISTSGKKESNVIQRVYNNDIGIPASGILVWHIDENIIRNRLTYNMVNADSSYRGISLVEADGITDLGIMFQDAFYQAAFDYGGAEDVFPHITTIEGKDTSIQIYGFGPFTLPSTKANDGGHTYLELSFLPFSKKTLLEFTAITKNDGIHYVKNFSDSFFTVIIKSDYSVNGWPKRVAPSFFFDPLIVDLDKREKGKEIFLTDSSGYVYIWNGKNISKNYNTIPIFVDRYDLLNRKIEGADTLFCFDKIYGIFTISTIVDDKIFLPAKGKKIYEFYWDTLLESIKKDSILLPSEPSSYVCNYYKNLWVIGFEDGKILYGKDRDILGIPQLPSDKPVCAIAAVNEYKGKVVVIHTDGTLSLVEIGDDKLNILSNVKISSKAIGPFSIITADINRDDKSEIIVADSRHGLWVYNLELKLVEGWTEEPNDWPSYYVFDTTGNRNNYPINLSSPVVADIDRDGYLDILIGGTNGLYAFNHKGALKTGWPAFLDKRFTHWYQRGSIVASPIVVTDAESKPLIIFSSPTGENLTYRFTKIIRADTSKGIVWFIKETGELDSVMELSKGEIDTLLRLSDSAIAPYTIPGGFVDALNSTGKRPKIKNISYWPLTTGSPVVTSPLIGDVDENGTPDLIVVSSGGWIYRWELNDAILPDSLFWPQNGYNGSRTFAYGGKKVPVVVIEKEPLEFFSYPNPVKKSDFVSFKYKFSELAKNVKIDIYSYSGYKVYSQNKMGSPPYELSGSAPDWNIHTVSIKNLGPGVYKCRIEAEIGGKKYYKYWKMAVVK
ncbi:MAG: hypothetical protein N2053_07630, partial [Chitinispirillaceae bacterium]|nr:hypothetical protein [Chitinispirillaceae bacterium]